jgi:hypothetical protein
VTTPQWREDSRRFAGLARAPVVALCLTCPELYLTRYSEEDKRESGLGNLAAGGGGEDAWMVPYWFGDAAFSTMVLLLGATDAEIGACFLGNFHPEQDLLRALDVPLGWRLFGTVLLGLPDDLDHPSPSLARPSPASARIHWGRWEGARSA